MYDLTFDTDQMLTIFTLKFPSTGFYAFFCQHYLDEFQGEMDSYLTDSEGNAVEFNWTSEEDPEAPWGDVILACFLVWIVTLSGLLVIALPTHLGFAGHIDHWKGRIRADFVALLCCRRSSLSCNVFDSLRSDPSHHRRL